MTVTYSGDVGNASAFGCFNAILLKWRGSVYKLIYKELCAYIVVYFLINLIYRVVLVPGSECSAHRPELVFPLTNTSTYSDEGGLEEEDEEERSSCHRWRTARQLFEALRGYCHTNLRSIPLMFVLGFYVSLVVQRWWEQYMLLPWPDSFAMKVVGLFQADPGDKRARLMRRNVIRYITLSYCIALRTVSFRLKKRFPSLEHLTTTGIMRPDELALFQKLDEKVIANQKLLLLIIISIFVINMISIKLNTKVTANKWFLIIIIMSIFIITMISIKLTTEVTANKWFLPLVWASKIITEGLAEGKIRPQCVSTLMSELCKVREGLTGILSYDWVCVPLVYTQLVTLAVYSYFAAALLGAQWVVPESSEAYRDLYKTSLGDQGAKLDLWYPFFLTLQFAFFVGWLKVAETLINPFGEDDDDFELNRLLDRHIQVGFLICDPTVAKPDLLKDKFWDSVIPSQLPYTKAAVPFKKCEFKGSAEKHLKIKETDKIYSDASLYGVASPPSARPSLPRRLRENLRLQLGEDEEDSTDDNYETVTSTQVY